MYKLALAALAGAYLALLLVGKADGTRPLKETGRHREAQAFEDGRRLGYSEAVADGAGVDIEDAKP